MTTSTAYHVPMLWHLAVGPIVWSLHFLTVYVGGAVACARLGRAAALPMSVQGLLVAATVAALGVFAIHAWICAHALRSASPPPQPFLMKMGLMLAAFSAFGVIVDTLPVAMIGTCR